MSIDSLRSTADAETAGRPRNMAHTGGFGSRAIWLVAPAIVFIAVFFLLPLCAMFARSLTDPSPANYARFVESYIYPFSLFTTLWMSAVVTVACLLLSYPYAYAMYQASGGMKALLTVIVLLPFWSSLLVRTYAWTVLLRDTGIINWLLLRAGLVEGPIQLMGNKLGVIIGMTHVLMPFMVLPIFASMQRMETDLQLAASGLGAKPAAVFRRIFFPLTLPGVLAGSLLVFVLSVGFYITPAILGGRTAFFSLLIVTHVNRLLEFGFGSTLGIILLAVVLLIVAIGARFVRLPDLFRSPQAGNN